MSSLPVIKHSDATKTRKIKITIEGFESEEEARRFLQSQLPKDAQPQGDYFQDATYDDKDKSFSVSGYLCCGLGTYPNCNTYWCDYPGATCWPYTTGCIA